MWRTTIAIILSGLVETRKMKRARSQAKPALALLTLCALNALVWSPPVLALDPSLDVTQYAHTEWTFRNGFLNGTVYAFAQTPDGYLWLGTQSGVVRFDGVRAVPLPVAPGQQFPSTSVGALLTARDGTLWIGTLGGLVSWKNGQLTTYPALAQQSVIALLETRDGTVWAGGFGSPTGKLCAVRGGSTNCYGDDGSLGAVVSSLHEDADGSLWVAAATGLWRWNPGPPTRYLSERIPSFQGFAQGDHGSGVVVAVDSVRQIVGQKLVDYPLHGVPSPLTAAHVLRDRNGGLWIGTNVHGVVHSYEGKTSLFTHGDGLTSDRVIALFEDREGTIWVATADGLDQFRESPVGSLSQREGLSSAIATSVLAARDGSIWIGTADGLNRWKDGRATIYRKLSDPGLPDDAIQSLFEDERGRIWVSGFRGVAVFEKGRFASVPSLPMGTTHAIADDNHGGLWLSRWLTPNGHDLVHLESKIIEHASWKSLGGGPGSGLVADPDGGVWTGLLSGGIAYFRTGQIRSLPLSGDGTGVPRVLNLSRDRDGALWAATENGLSRITNGRVATLTTANGLPCNTVHWIIEDDRSSYWLYTRCGLLRVARTELDAWTADPKRKIRVATFDTADGIRPVGLLRGFRPSVTKSSDGKIWFLNGDTVSFIDPSHIDINTLPPPVHIEQITANRKLYAPTPGLRLPPLVHELTINYTALSLAAPQKVHFRYRLEGQDPDWREVVNDRGVQYSNLDPGNYRFRVAASNNSGVWNEAGDTLEFSIASAYFQTNWFRALSAAVFLALLWAAYQFRVRQLEQGFNMRVEGRVEERARIARDLHDTLLQSFQGLIPVFQTARNLLPGQSDRAAEVLDEGLHDAADAIVEGRNAIQNLRAKPSLDPDLGSLLNAAGKDLAQSPEAEGSATAFRVVVEGPRLPLAPLLQDEIYRIGREMLRNAFRHAHASRIEAEIRYDRDVFRLRVRDDGKGIDSSVLKEGARAGHWGLPGIHERAKKMGGHLKIWSEPGAGTEAELTVPARTAYEKFSTSNGWWARLGRRLRLTAPNREA
jgi:signal transduction histidine kinase/ligand-binding sensor domain-containing protein